VSQDLLSTGLSCPSRDQDDRPLRQTQGGIVAGRNTVAPRRGSWRGCSAGNCGRTGFGRGSAEIGQGGTPTMTCRTRRDRLYQSIGYEVGGILVVTPILAGFTDAGLGTSALLGGLLTVATLFWAPLFNTAFDRIEWRRTGRVASERGAVMRVVHAFALETSDTIVTLPILVLVGGLPLGEAVVADIGLTLVWTAYTCAYHLAFDRLRPVAVA
jgi:uncharacterized membrane protein